MTSQSLRSWLIPTAYSPLNVAIARYAPVLAMIEWLVILASGFKLLPAIEIKEPWNHYVLGIGSTCFLLIGIRGLRVGHVRRIGSLILITTNVSLLLIYFLPVISYYF